MKNNIDFAQKNFGVHGKILFFGFFILMVGLGLFLSQSFLPAQATKQLKNPNPLTIEKNPVQNQTAPKIDLDDKDPAVKELKNLPFSENRKSYSVIIESKPGPDGKRIQTKKVWKNGVLAEESTETIDPNASGNPSIQLPNGKNAQGHVLRSERFGDLSINPGDDPAAMINELQKRLQDQRQFHMDQMREMSKLFGGFPDDAFGSPVAPVVPVKLSKYWIGAAVHPVPEIVAAQLDLKDKGVIVVNLVSDSPAQKAGLIRFDVITAVNGIPITNGSQIGEILDQAEGKAVKVDYIRKGKANQLDLTPVQRPDPKDPANAGIFSNDENEEERSIRVVRPGLIVPSDSLNTPQKEKKNEPQKEVPKKENDQK